MQHYVWQIGNSYRHRNGNWYRSRMLTLWSTLSVLFHMQNTHLFLPRPLKISSNLIIRHKIDFIPSSLPPKRAIVIEDRGPGRRYLVLFLSQEWGVVLFPLKYFTFEKTHSVCLCQDSLPSGLVWVRNFIGCSLISWVPKIFPGRPRGSGVL